MNDGKGLDTGVGSAHHIGAEGFVRTDMNRESAGKLCRPAAHRPAHAVRTGEAGGRA